MQISLGEGNTPEVNLRRVADALGLDKLRAKLEFMAPTGSFKDRGSALLVSLARQEGVQGFVEDSSGNAGASLSAYAAAAGMNAHIFVPATAASGKLDQIRIFGATLHAVEGPRQAATEAAQEFVRESGLPYLSHSLSPFFSEGMKPFAYEVTGHGGGIPDHIVLPVGNGSLLIGARAGFDELVASGVIARHPRFHAVQMESVCPVAAAINGEDWNPSQAAPTVASGIAVSAPPRLAQCVSAVQSSGGTAVTVTDEAALSWQRRLAAGDGIFCEATSAVAFAGLEKLVASGVISAGETVLVPVTGSGLKEQLPV
jgi:threonine synthase